MTPICLEPNILKQLKGYLATIVNYWIVCCDAVRSAILATAWLLVNVVHWCARGFHNNRLIISSTGLFITQSSLQLCESHLFVTLTDHNNERFIFCTYVQYVSLWESKRWPVLSTDQHSPHQSDAQSISNHWHAYTTVSSTSKPFNNNKPPLIDSFSCVMKSCCGSFSFYNVINNRFWWRFVERCQFSIQRDNTGLALTRINAKKHSLSHQLTAQLHIENSKNKKWWYNYCSISPKCRLFHYHCYFSSFRMMSGLI